MERGMVRRIDDTRAMARFIFTTLFPLYDGYSYRREREREVKIIRVLRGAIVNLRFKLVATDSPTENPKSLFWSKLLLPISG